MMHAIFDLTTLDERTLTLRQRCLDRKHAITPWIGDPRFAAQSLQASALTAPWTVRRGLVTREILRSTAFALDDLELLVGRLAPDRPEWIEERQRARAFLDEHYPRLDTPGQTGHCQLDLSRLFERGIDGLQDDLEACFRRAQGKQADVFRSFIDALDGLSQMIENAARTAEQSRQGASTERAAELSEMAAVCWRVAHEPPHTFWEALQFSYLAILGCQVGDRAALVSPGHLDRILWPFYQADIAAGRLAPEKALLLIENLYLLLNENIPDGLAVSVMVGGRDRDGNDLTNPLSYLCLEALRRTKLVYPTVGICWHTATPEALTDLALDLITQGYANPAFFGDETIQRGLQKYGVPVEESWDYVNSTCVEITPVGASNVWVASPYFSLCKILLDEIADQAQSALPTSGFQSFMDGYFARLSAEIERAVAHENTLRLARQQFGGKPLQSVFTRDCIQRGRDIDDGGARYNWIECSFVGLANLVDSLHVLRTEVFHHHRYALGEMHRILASDFEGFEVERLRFLNAYPKYGNNCLEVDQLVSEVVSALQEACARCSVAPDGSPYVPGAFCWVMHERLGRECGATPDGRRAGFPFADGCGAAQGRERLGPTAAVLSVTSWDASPLIGGAAFNMKFPASFFSDAGATRRLRDLVVTFLKLGGFETQVNVVDSSVLRKAQADPESYRDLVVRIGGYTDYFTRLTPQMQAEVILRTEYSEL
jgi:trans-4-hydroxy-L-proline dehydratase